MNMYGNYMPTQGVQGAMQGNGPNQVQGASHGPYMPNPGVQGSMQGANPNQAVQGAMMPGKEKQLVGDMGQLCKQYNHYHAKVRMQDGMEYEGIIMDSDDEHMSMMIPQEVEEPEGDGMNRQFGGYRYRRFGRFFFPLAGIAALSLIPFYRPYPYYGYPYYY